MLKVSKYYLLFIIRAFLTLFFIYGKGVAMYCENVKRIEKEGGVTSRL